MYRKIENLLYDWKEQENAKPLLIKGARQVGKSYEIRKFGQSQYPNYVEINLESNLYMKNVFEQTMEVKEILMLYKVKYPEPVINKEDTLIFLDEIQACPNALTCLKFFSIEGYRVIASGSLLGIALTHTSSFPVGYVQVEELCPMDFEEFLYANGVEKSIVELLNRNYQEGSAVLEPLHQQMNTYFKQYIICGGMPEAVKTFVKTKDFQKVKIVQKQIIEGYYADLAKYGDHLEKLRAHECFSSIPAQLAKDNKKFQYKVVRQGATGRMYGTSLKWLEDSGIIRLLYRLDNLELPLEAHRSVSSFKVYMNDTGLLMAMFEEDLAYRILQNELLIFKGAIFENVVHQCLYSKHRQLYYYEYRGNYEIDFVMIHNNAVLPIEVKSSTNTRAKRLRTVVERYQLPLAYKLSLNNVNTQESTTKCYPLYMLMFM